MAIDVAQVLQQIADAVEGLNGRQETLDQAKAAFDAASQDYQAAVAKVESLRAQISDLLGATAQGRSRVRV